MQIDALFFDLDGTLYPNGAGIWNAISEKMNEYMHLKLAIPHDKVSEIREGYFHKYGTTLRGLQNHFAVDPREYLNFVHDIPVSKILKPDLKLRELLIQDKNPKWILTNSDSVHSNRVLDALGIRDQFLGIIDVWATDFNPKPSFHFFETSMKIAGFTNSDSIIFYDDIPQNVKGAKDFGFNSVYVGKGIIDDGIEHHIKSIHDFQNIKRMLNQ